MNYLALAARHWKLIGLGLVCLLLAVQTVRLGAEQNSHERTKINLREVRAERDNLIAAQVEARRLNDEQVQRIEKEQEAITDEVERDLTLRLERLRSELRSKAAPRNPGSSQASPDGKAPGGTPQEAGVCLAPDELLRAAENEERHDQLITWIEKQLGVER